MRARLGGPIALVLGLVGMPSAVAAAPATKPCRDDRTARCGIVRVPLLRGAPHGGGRKLRVYFRVFPWTDRSRPALEPIVAAEGGPGYYYAHGPVRLRLRRVRFVADLAVAEASCGSGVRAWSPRGCG
jgi:hypothetical protein